MVQTYNEAVDKPVGNADARAADGHQTRRQAGLTHAWPICNIMIYN